MIRTLSLGWGVQSFALAAMSALGILPLVDAAVHADTGHERAETYEFAVRWTPWLEERGVPVVTVRAPAKVTSVANGPTPPYFTLSTTGERGVLYRTCSDRWKIREIKRWIRTQIGSGEVAETWIGVIRWLRDNDLEVPAKSACVFCPFHTRAIWREIQLGGNGDWEKALAVDRAIRNRRAGAGYRCYLTAQRKPLDECDFRSEEERGQMTFAEMTQGEKSENGEK